MLILLPPSEGKSAPARGPALDLGRLSFPELTDRRARMLDELDALCSGDVEKAADVLGLGPRQHGEVARNAALREAPTAPAARVYTGVLYAALDHQTMRGTALRRVNRWVAVQSALFGLVRLGDRIPAYRLSADVSLPGLGKVSAAWREHMRSVSPPVAGSGLVVDMRSAAYAAFWKPAPDMVTVRVLQEVDGRRKVVSHANKATKGRIVRAVAEDGAAPRTAGELAEHLRGLGWHTETGAAGRLDVVVAEV